jgi:hypothetical protein
MPDASPAIRAGIESLRGVAGVAIAGEPVFAAGDWHLPVRLSTDAPSADVPAVTAWFVCFASDYPVGIVKLKPAQDGGLHATFNHMGRNAATTYQWRTGAPCLERPGRWLTHRETVGEATAANERLREFVQRGREWLQAAAAGELISPGEPFELPEFPCSGPTFGFDEDNERYAFWSNHLRAVGTATIATITPLTMVVREFRQRDACVLPPRWGTRITELDRIDDAFWLTLPRMPVIHPYDVPATWGALRATADAMGVGFDGKLRSMYERLYAAKSSDASLLCVGFPIPKTYDGPPNQMHWQPLVLPALCQAAADTAGSSSFDVTWSRMLAGPLANACPLSWGKSENWSERQLAVRGALFEGLRRARVLVIGAGALGSIVAELLVRAGVNDVFICDFEDLEVGNLRRHVLSLASAGYGKAMALCVHLNDVSPYARVRYSPLMFPNLGADAQAVAQSDVVIDCTASDDVAQRLSTFPWALGDRWFFSASTGANARRMFFYSNYGPSFDAADFNAKLGPHLPAEKAEFAKIDPHRMSGAGCWNPVFPARYEAILRFGADAVDLIDRCVAGADGVANAFRIVEKS